MLAAYLQTRRSTSDHCPDELLDGGLLLNSPAVVIGSMCVAPFLGPSRAVCIGAVFRDGKTVLGGLVKQLLGLFVVGAGLAFVTTVLLRSRVPGVEITPEILVRAMRTAPEAVLSVLIAVTAGAAASLALVWVNRRVIDAGDTFPELSRVPFVRRLLSVEGG